jgi:hypothetical protein
MDLFYIDLIDNGLVLGKKFSSRPCPADGKRSGSDVSETRCIKIILSLNLKKILIPLMPLKSFKIKKNNPRYSETFNIEESALF